MANISGCYRWNDSLTLAEKGYLFEGRIVANGMIYTEMMIVPAEDGTTMIALFEEDENMALVYFSESGWIGAVSIYDERPIIAKSDLWQTWDFGEGIAILESVFTHSTINWQCNFTYIFAAVEGICRQLHLLSNSY